MRQSGAGLSVRPGQKNFTPESSGVKSMINSTVPPCLRPRRAVARDRCNGRARPGHPRRLGSGGLCQGGSAGTFHQTVPSLGGAFRRLLRHCRFLSLYYSTSRNGLSRGEFAENIPFLPCGTPRDICPRTYKLTCRWMRSAVSKVYGSNGRQFLH